MPIIIGETTTTQNGVRYIISPEHRAGGNHAKSKWAISPDEEVLCFVDCLKNNWLSSKNGWGLIANNGRGNFTLLGHSPTMMELYLAKFVDSNPWHGYPANIRQNIHDRPGNIILMDWYKKELIYKHQVSRIKNGRI
jgi:hypothetical protein